MGEVFTHTKRLKPLKAYMVRTPRKRSTGDDAQQLLGALGITPSELEEAHAKLLARDGGSGDGSLHPPS